MKLAAIQRFDTAVELIIRGMRLSIVSHITGIPLKPLRSLHRELLGCGPTAGPLPSTRRIFATRSAQASASLLAALYRSAGGRSIYDRIDMTALLSAHDLYWELMAVAVSSTSPIKRLDINQAWIIARDIRTGAAYFQACRHCHIQLISATDARSPLNCPICALRRQESAKRTDGLNKNHP